MGSRLFVVPFKSNLKLVTATCTFSK